MSDEMAEVIDEQKQWFVEKYGRDPGPGDNLFFDMPPLSPSRLNDWSTHNGFCPLL